MSRVTARVPTAHRARPTTSACVAFGFFLLVNPIQAQTPDTLPPPAALKRLTLEQLMDIEVTSVSRRPEKLSTTASAIQIITGDDIRRSGATSIPEALRLATNLQVAQVNASQWAVSARGFNNVLANKLLVLIDGRTVYTPLYAGVFWDVQNVPLESVDRIEVVSGPGGALWGANAVNGVINIITKNAGSTQGLSVEGVGGNELGLGVLRYGGRSRSGLSYRVYGEGFKRGSTVRYDGTDAQDSWGLAQGGFRVDWGGGKANGFMIEGDYYDGRPDPDGGAEVVVRGGNAVGRWTRALSEGSDLRVQVYYDRWTRCPIRRCRAMPAWTCGSGGAPPSTWSWRWWARTCCTTSTPSSSPPPRLHDGCSARSTEKSPGADRGQTTARARRRSLPFRCTPALPSRSSFPGRLERTL